MTGSPTERSRASLGQKIRHRKRCQHRWKILIKSRFMAKGTFSSRKDRALYRAEKLRKKLPLLPKILKNRSSPVPDTGEKYAPVMPHKSAGSRENEKRANRVPDARYGPPFCSNGAGYVLFISPSSSEDSSRPCPCGIALFTPCSNVWENIAHLCVCRTAKGWGDKKPPV